MARPLVSRRNDFDGASPFDGTGNPADLAGNSGINATALEVGIIVGVVVAITLTIVWMFVWRARKNRNARNNDPEAAAAEQPQPQPYAQSPPQIDVAINEHDHKYEQDEGASQANNDKLSVESPSPRKPLTSWKNWGKHSRHDSDEVEMSSQPKHQATFV